MTLPSVVLPSVRSYVADLRPKRGALEGRSLSSRTIAIPAIARRPAALPTVGRVVRSAQLLARAISPPSLSAPVFRSARKPPPSLSRAVVRDPRPAVSATAARNSAGVPSSRLSASSSVHDASFSQAHSAKPRADGLSHCKQRPSSSRSSGSSVGRSRFIPWCRS